MNWSSFYQKQIWYILVLEKRNEIKQREIKAWRGLNSCLKIDLFCSFSKAQPGSCGRVQAQRGVHQHGCGRGSAVFCGHEAPLLQVTSTFVFLSLSLSFPLCFLRRVFCPFGQENRFCAKQTPQNRLFWWTQIWLPGFGRLGTPNGWHQVNF